jgi:hypothetical protein
LVVGEGEGWEVGALGGEVEAEGVGGEVGEAVEVVVGERVAGEGDGV